MSHSHQAPEVYPPPQSRAYSLLGPCVAAPPARFPMKDAHPKSRGDGFWKGCCAALCCCCVLDACFLGY